MGRYPRMDLEQKLANQKEAGRRYSASPKGKLRQKLRRAGLSKEVIDAEIRKSDRR